MSRKIKGEQKKFLGETLNQYDKALNEGITQLDKKNREQNHKISALVNSFDNEYLEKDVEGNMTTLENSKDGVVIINEIQGSTEVNYCKDGEKELILNGDIDTQGESFVTITEGVDGGLVDVSLEGNTEINLSKTKDPVLVTREFDDINCNVGKLQYTIDDVTTINDEPGKVDIDRIIGDTMVNHAVNGSEELILNAHINKSGDNNITLNGVTSDGGKVDVALEGNTLVNVSNVKDDYITPTIEDKVDQGSVISLPEVSEGLIHIDEIEGNTMVNYCTDGAKELTLNGDIDIEGTFVTTTEGVDNGLVDVALEGNTLVNLCQRKGADITSLYLYGTSGDGKIDVTEIENGCKYTTLSDTDSYITVRLSTHTVMKPNTTYTLTFEIVKNTLNFDYHGITVNGTHDAFFGNGNNKVFYDGNFALTVGVKKMSFTTPSDISTYNGFGYGFPNIKTTEPGMEFVIKNTMLLEGDWTDKEIPQYFEGMKSVGQDDVNGHKIEILSNNNGSLSNISTHNFDTDGKRIYHNLLEPIKNGESFKICYANNTSKNTNLGIGLHYPSSTVYASFGGLGNNSSVITNNTGETLTKISTYRDNNYDGLVIENFSITKVKDIEDTSFIDYKPYQSNKKEIPLNEPLRSLPNGVKDRFVKIGGKWFVERNCYKVTLDGTNTTFNHITANETDTHIQFNLGAFDNKVNSNNAICDVLPINNNAGSPGISEEGVACQHQGTIVVRILKSKLNSSDTTGFKTYLKANPITVVYQLATPVYEPLEIEPTLNTYNDVTYLSNNSIIPCNMQIKNTGYNAIIKPSTLYTVAVDTNKSGTIGINLGGAEVTTTNNVATITTPSILTDDSLRLYGKGIKCSKVRLLKGNKTNFIPCFFEGMKSSFEDKAQGDGSYKMEVSMSNENLLDLNSKAYKTNFSWDRLIYRGDAETSVTDIEIGEKIKFKIIQRPTYGLAFLIKTIPNKKYTISATGKCIGGTKQNEVDYFTLAFRTDIDSIETWKKKPQPTDFLREYANTRNIPINTKGSLTFVAKSNYSLVGFCSTFKDWNNSDTPSNDTAIFEFEDVMVTESENVKDFIENKSNKIQLSSIEPLRKWDRFVFKDGQLMIERGSRLVDLSTIPFMRNEDKDKCWKFGIQMDSAKRLPDGMRSNLICNSLPVDGEETKYSTITIYPHANSLELRLCIRKCEMSSSDENGLREWLSKNPTEIVYELETPTYEEIPYELQKIILESYNNGTLFIDTNIPPTKVSFNCFEEELTYLYPSTSYTLQFNSDRNTTADVILGGTELLAQSIVKGLNRITITTPDTLANNKLVIDGIGANIREIVVSDTDREFDYFEGMKSVGECEELEVKSVNKNLFDIELWKSNPIFKERGDIIWNGDDFTVTANVDDCWGATGVTSGRPYEDYMEKYLIKVKPNTKYTISFNRDSNASAFTTYACFYAKDRTFLKMVYIQSTEITIQSPNNAFYMAFRVGVRGIGNYATYSNIQIEEYGEKTTYVKHQSNAQQLTHEPLRAVGDYKDRYILIDGKWYIERNVGLLDCTKIGVWNKGNGGEFYRYGFLNDIKTEFSNDISNHCKFSCNTYPVGKVGDESKGLRQVAIYNHNGDLKGQIRILEPSCNTVDEFYTYMQNNPTYVTYPKNTTYEPINYNPLEVYSDTTHITTNSTIPCNVTVKNHGYNMVALKENTQYTLYVDKNTTNALTYRLGDYVEINSPSKFTFTTPSTLTDKTLRIDGKGAKVKDLMLIEGTPTNDSIGYFDGLKSSYECEQVTDENDENYGKYKVDIKVVGKNLCPNKFYSGWSDRLGTLCSDDNVVSELIKVKPNSNYIINEANFSYLFKYDSNKKFIGQEVVFQTFNTKNAVYIRMAQSIGASNIYLENYDNTIQIEEGDTVTEYEPYFESTQTIYLNSPLLKGDEIVWKDNKIQHYHKMKTIVLDGSDDEDWKKYAETNVVTQFITPKPQNIYTQFAICNNFIVTDANRERGFEMYIGGSNFNFMLPSSFTLNDFKQWLQDNPVTVVYQLLTPYYEEISDYPLKLNIIANSSLSTESTIQVTNISFNIYEETLPYLYPNTKYYITFNADVDRNNIIIDLGGNHVVFDCKVGFNKVEITTPSDTTNLLTFSGTGVNIDHVKVTQQDIDEYFEGMKSVGECENNTLEIICKNNDNSKSNTQTLTHEPLRSVGDVKDKYVLIDGKWYIERNCAEVVLDGSDDEEWRRQPELDTENTERYWITKINGIPLQCKVNVPSCNNLMYPIITDSNTCCYTHVEIPRIDIRKLKTDNRWNDVDTLKQWLSRNPLNMVYQLAIPQYEQIDYNPLEVYSDVTHISNNSLIPSNMVIKNHGYNTILKPSTKYTVALNKLNGTIGASLGGSSKVDSTNNIFTITTPSTLNDNVLRLSGSGNVKDIMILEGDKTVNTPSYFEGMESAFEQEYDAEKGKYRVTAKVDGNGKESSIIFYINEPLRGTDTAKDRVFIQDGKVVVQRNCGSVTLDGSDDEGWSGNTNNSSIIRFCYFNLRNIVAQAPLNIVSDCFPSNNDTQTLESIFMYTNDGIVIAISKSKLQTQDVAGFRQWLQQNPTTVVYQLAEPVYEEVDCDLSKLVLENYSNSSLIFESNIPVSANIKYSGEVPVVTQAKALSSKVDNTTLDINENIIPYMCDIDYRIVELQLMNGDTQGEGIELLGIGDIEILGNENVLFNNREDKKYNYSYDMLKRDILSQRYSKEEYQYRLDRYLLANKISDEEYKELEGLLNNGE